jgi:hypothetical protein
MISTNERMESEFRLTSGVLLISHPEERQNGQTYRSHLKLRGAIIFLKVPEAASAPLPQERRERRASRVLLRPSSSCPALSPGRLQFSRFHLRNSSIETAAAIGISIFACLSSIPPFAITASFSATFKLSLLNLNWLSLNRRRVFCLPIGALDRKSVV